jgi:hypothetical protein
METSSKPSLSQQLLGWGVALALAVFVGVALARTLGEVRYQPTSDEGYYLKYMRDVGEQGLGAFPDLFRYYLGDARHHIFPPPSRVGFAVVSAAWGVATEASLPALSKLSLASHLLLILAVYGFASRWFGVARALLATALVATSTLCLGLARHALTDSFITLSQFLVLALFVEYVRAPRSLARTLAFGAAFTFAILTKEIAVLLAVPLAAWAAVERWQAGRDVPVARTLIVLAAPVIATILVWVVAAGSPILLYRVMRIVLLSPATNDYALRYGSGGWFRYPVDELLMSPAATLTGIAAVVVSLWRWRKSEYLSVPVGLSLVYVGQLICLAPFTKNLRYVTLLEVPLRVLAVLLLWELFAAERSRTRLAMCCAAVGLLCWTSWADYQLIWLKFHGYDPITALLVGVRELVPMTPGN